MAEEELELEVKKKSKLPLIIVIVAVLLLGGGGAAFFLLGGSDDATQAEGATPADAAPEAVESLEIGNAMYVAMPRPFVFNVMGGGKDRLVQIKVQLMVRGEDSEMLVKKHIPLVEGTLLKTFSSTTGDEMATLEGKELLREQALQDVRQAMIEVEGQSVIDKVLFTGFVMQ